MHDQIAYHRLAGIDKGGAVHIFAKGTKNEILVIEEQGGLTES